MFQQSRRLKQWTVVICHSQDSSSLDDSVFGTVLCFRRIRGQKRHLFLMALSQRNWRKQRHHSSWGKRKTSYQLWEAVCKDFEIISAGSVGKSVCKAQLTSQRQLKHSSQFYGLMQSVVLPQFNKLHCCALKDLGPDAGCSLQLKAVPWSFTLCSLSSQ